MVVDLHEQELVDKYLPPCRVPHQLDPDNPTTIGGLTWPRETEHHRIEIQQAMERAPEVFEEALDEFEKVFGRRPDGSLAPRQTDDAEVVLIACNTMARTLQRVVAARREKGERVGQTHRCAGPQPLARFGRHLLAGSRDDPAGQARPDHPGLSGRVGWW